MSKRHCCMSIQLSANDCSLHSFFYSSLAKVTEFFQEVLLKMSSSFLNLSNIVSGMTVGLQHLLHAPVLAKAIVDASETIPCADIEKACELVLYLGPGESSNDALVHDEELLLLRVGMPCGPRDTLT